MVTFLSFPEAVKIYFTLRDFIYFMNIFEEELRKIYIRLCHSLEPENCKNDDFIQLLCEIQLFGVCST
jgi:hypothetical protein